MQDFEMIGVFYLGQKYRLAIKTDRGSSLMRRTR